MVFKACFVPDRTGMDASASTESLAYYKQHLPPYTWTAVIKVKTIEREVKLPPYPK